MPGLELVEECVHPCDPFLVLVQALALVAIDRV
jgi:hypothetical protein